MSTGACRSRAQHLLLKTGARPIGAPNQQDDLSDDVAQKESLVVGTNAIRNKISTGGAQCGWLVVQTILDGPGQLRTVEFIVVGSPDPRQCEAMVRAAGTGVCPEDMVRAARRLSERELEKV